MTKKIKLIRVYCNDYHNYENNIDRFFPESEYIEVSDEEYELLRDYRVREKILKNRHGVNQFSDKLIMVEDMTKEIPKLITSAAEILGDIKKKEKIEKEKKERAAKDIKRSWRNLK